VALTSSVVAYQRAGEDIRDEVEVVLVNRRKIDLLEPISPTEMETPAGPAPAVPPAPGTKDLTGDLFA